MAERGPGVCKGVRGISSRACIVFTFFTKNISRKSEMTLTECEPAAQAEGKHTAVQQFPSNTFLYQDMALKDAFLRDVVCFLSHIK